MNSENLSEKGWSSVNHRRVLLAKTWTGLVGDRGLAMGFPTLGQWSFELLLVVEEISPPAKILTVGNPSFQSTKWKPQKVHVFCLKNPDEREGKTIRKIGFAQVRTGNCQHLSCDSYCWWVFSDGLLFSSRSVTIARNNQSKRWVNGSLLIWSLAGINVRHFKKKNIKHCLTENMDHWIKRWPGKQRVGTIKNDGLRKGSSSQLWGFFGVYTYILYIYIHIIGFLGCKHLLFPN